MACTSGCKTQDHASYADCLKAKAPKVGYCNEVKGVDYTREKKWEQRLTAYANARKEGIQPETTHSADIEKAVRISDQTGTAFRAD